MGEHGLGRRGKWVRTRMMIFNKKSFEIRIRPVEILKLRFETAFHNLRSMKFFDKNRHN